MDDERLVDRARRNRSSSAVLKTRVSNVRSKHPGDPIFIFEGFDDVGAYEVWISRAKVNLRYIPLAASGKAQILDLRRRFEVDQVNLSENVYFFVDRDFDELRGQSQGMDIFCTSTYSIENYLVTDLVLRSILLDEFRCPPEQPDVDKAISVYEEVLQQFIQCMNEANLRIFRANRLNIRGGGVEERITRYVQIEVHQVERVYMPVDLSKLVRLEREPSPEDCREPDLEFESLDPLKHHRGKYLLAFFRFWLQLLATKRREDPAPIFEETGNLRFSIETLNTRSLASRSAIPAGLADFLLSMGEARSTTPT